MLQNTWISSYYSGMSVTFIFSPLARESLRFLCPKLPCIHMLHMSLAGYNDFFTDMCRYFKNGGSKLYGKIEWNLWERKLELRPNLGSKEGTRSILWEDKGNVRNNESDAEECMLEVAAFVKNFGGPNYQEQWDAISLIHFKLWITATDLCGHPRLVPIDEKPIDDALDGSSDGSNRDSNDPSNNTVDWYWDEGRRDYYHYDHLQRVYIYASGNRISNPLT
jgi:hypothetical protein